jgi:hypothetical protein
MLEIMGRSGAFRTAIALVAAPLVAALILVAFEQCYLASMGSAPDDVFNVWIAFSFILLGASLSVGLILHAVLHQLRRQNLLWYILGAATGGSCIAALLRQKIHDTAFWMSHSDAAETILILALGAGSAMLNSAIFWLIRRPDRDAANPPTSTP